MDIVRLWSEPAVHELGFAARAAVHTGIWALWLLLMQYAIMALVGVLRKTHLQQYTHAPKHSWRRMLAESALGYLGFSWHLGLLAAWLNPGAVGGSQWDYSCPNLLLLGYYATACLMLYDAYSYFLHKWMHENKTAFRCMHMKHHDMKAALDVTTSAYMELTECVFSSAAPMAVLYLLGVSTGNWWYTLASIWHAFNIVITGHCGAEVTLNHWKDLALLLLNPFGLWYSTCPASARPMHHADHHMHPRVNYAFFFTYWDALNGSSKPSNPPCSLLVLTAHAVWQLLLFSTVYAAVTHPVAALTVYVTCYLVVPPRAAATLADLLHVPHITRALSGSLMDQFRADNFITYAHEGVPGAFIARTVTPALDVTNTTAAEGDRIGQDITRHEPACTPSSRGKDPVYIFACHPTGLLSRAAFCTFAARGWRSPVSVLRDVRLAVGTVLFLLPLPFMREFLLACGCIPADRDSMRNALRSGCSIAVTPGGWREARYNGSCKLVLKRRMGFIQLAQETRAVLVPVLCLGEEDLALMPQDVKSVFVLWLYRFATVFRPHPVKVLYGQPITPEPGESTEQLHSRYVHALLELGRQHNVQLELTE